MAVECLIDSRDGFLTIYNGVCLLPLLYLGSCVLSVVCLYVCLFMCLLATFRPTRALPVERRADYCLKIVHVWI